MNANELARSRNWMTADIAKLHSFGDCFRAHLYWNDGGEAYTLHDTKEEALADLRRWGWNA